MKKIFFLFCAIFSSVCNATLQDYLTLVKESIILKPLGNHRIGEIEIVLDSIEISKIEAVQAARLVKKGLSPDEAAESSRVGIIADDIYWLWIRDAVIFPTGAVGTYDRLVWKSGLSGPPGVAIMPILPNGKIALNLNYRHATRSWELELARGAISKGEGIEQTARRELEEETGLLVKDVKLLGIMTPDTGVLASAVPIFIGWVKGKVDSSIEESEAILGTRAFSFDEIKKGLRLGKISVEIDGKMEDVPVRDSFITYALFQALNFGFL